MRKNLTIVLLSVGCTLLIVNLAVMLSQPQARLALSQGTAIPTGSVALAAVMGTSMEPWVFIYDVQTQHLASYKNTNQGLMLKGMRQITWDLKIEELAPTAASKGATVKEVKNALSKSSGGASSTGKKTTSKKGGEEEGGGEEETGGEEEGTE
jgi:hypothetical protein